jgi:hypothetical protein
MLALVMLRDLVFLSFTALLGDVAVTVALIAVVAYGATTKHVVWTVPLVNLRQLARCVGSVCFLFAIHIVVLPILNAMAAPERYARVTRRAFSFITALNACFGAVAYLLFAGDVANPVTDNLDGGSRAAKLTLGAVKLLLCVDLLFTVPFVFAAGREIVERATLEMLPRCAAGRARFRSPETHARNAVRVALLGAVFAIRFGVPCFGDLVDLIGGVVNAVMGFVLPPAIALKLFPMSWAARAAHLAIILFGLAALGLSLTFTIESLLDPDHSC